MLVAGINEQDDAGDDDGDEGLEDEVNNGATVNAGEGEEDLEGYEEGEEEEDDE